MKQGQAAYNDKQYHVAEQFFTEALKLAEANGDGGGTVTVLGYLGRTYSSLGNIEKAEDALLRRRTLSDSLKLDRFVRSETRYALAIFYGSRRRCDKLDEVLNEVREIISSESEPPDFVETLTSINSIKSHLCSN